MYPIYLKVLTEIQLDILICDQMKGEIQIFTVFKTTAKVLEVTYKVTLNGNLPLMTQVKKICEKLHLTLERTWRLGFQIL